MRYCTECGSELIQTPDVKNNWRKGLKNYDSNTGERIDYSGIRYECPYQTILKTHTRFFIENRKEN